MTQHTAQCEMLIRAPRGEVFDAFARRDMLRKFWLEDASGDLAPGARVEWAFMVPGVRDSLEVIEFERDSRIVFRWSGGSVTTLAFADYADGYTRVSVLVTGLSDHEAVVNETHGYAIVLCDLKSLLETGVSGGMVRDAARLIADGRPGPP